MQLTDEQLEQAARELKEMIYAKAGINNDIKVCRREIRNWLLIQEAVNRVVGK